MKLSWFVPKIELVLKIYILQAKVHGFLIQYKAKKFYWKKIDLKKFDFWRKINYNIFYEKMSYFFS